MSDQEKCIRETQVEIARAAIQVRALSSHLRSIGGRLRSTAIESLPGELLHGIEAVRSDLLSDAADTLNTLAQMSEDDVARRHAEIADFTVRLAGDA